MHKNLHFRSRDSWIILLSIGLVLSGCAVMVVALWMTLGVHLIADDLAILLDWGSRRTKSGVAQSLWHLVSESVSFAHVVPLGGLQTGIQGEVAFSVAPRIGLDPQVTWKWMRIAFPIVALWCACDATVGVLYSLRRRKGGFAARWLLPRALLFSVASVALAATIQLRAPYSLDPVLSFSAAGWGTVAIGFLYLAAVAGVSNMRDVSPLSSIATTVLGIMAVLYYEMIAAFVLCSVLVVVRSLWCHRRVRASACWLVVSVLIPALTIGGAYMFRVHYLIPKQENVYTGTTVSFASTEGVIRAFGVELLTSMPFSTTKRAALLGIHPYDRAGESLGLIILFLVLTITIVVLIRVVVGLRCPTLYLPVSPTWGAGGWLSSVLILVCIALLATAPFAVSARYGEELGTTVGQAHTFYAVGATVFAVVFSLLAFRYLYLRTAAGGVALVMILSISFVFHASLNEPVAQVTAGGPNMTKAIDYAWSGTGSNRDRCNALEETQAWPEYYSKQVATSLRIIYADRFDGNYCVK